jgi:hypothetical protein
MAAMLSNENFEETKTGVLIIKDFSPKVIRQLLTFFYSFTIPDVSEETISDLYLAADKVSKFSYSLIHKENN